MCPDVFLWNKGNKDFVFVFVLYVMLYINGLTSNSGAINQLNDSYRYNIPFVWLCDTNGIHVVNMLCIAAFSVFAWLCALLWHKNETLWYT